MSEPEIYPLDETAIESFQEIDQQEKLWAASLGGARSALLGHFCRQHKLSGAWRLADNRREIVKVEMNGQPQPIPAEISNGTET